MPSEKLTRILRAKSPFSEDAIANISEAEGWAWVYENRPPPRPGRYEICFTGFGATDSAELKQRAIESGWLHICTSVTKGLHFLCIGDHAGPAKLKRAAEQGVTILSRAEFVELITHGVLPSIPSTSDAQDNRRDFRAAKAEQT